MNTGYAALVGAGPGDPGLMTVKGLSLLKEAQVVIYDRLVSPAILEQIPDTALMVDVGKTSGHHPVQQEAITEQIVRYAQEGKRVVRLKGGDPYVFGRGGEEAKALSKAGISYTVVPGITSAVGAAAYAGIPITHRDYASSFTVITGHRKKNMPLRLPYQELVGLGGTLVFLMGVANVSEIAQGLMAAGMEPEMPVAMVENGTLGGQRKLLATLGTVAQEAQQAAITSPAILIVGKVCRLSDALDWFQTLPLRGRRILVTGPVTAKPHRLTQGLIQAGAEVRHEPLIRIEALENVIIPELSGYEWLTFSSGRGVEVFFEALTRQGRDARALAGCRIAAVGSRTAETLTEHGILPDLVPEVYSGEALAQQLLKHIEGRVLVLEAERAGRGLTEGLAAGGILYDRIPLYHTLGQTLPEAVCKELTEGWYTDVVVTSASAARELCRQVPVCEVPVTCIGQATAAELTAWSGEISVSQEATYESIVETMCLNLK